MSLFFISFFCLKRILFLMNILLQAKCHFVHSVGTFVDLSNAPSSPSMNQLKYLPRAILSPHVHLFSCSTENGFWFSGESFSEAAILSCQDFVLWLEQFFSKPVSSEIARKAFRWIEKTISPKLFFLSSSNVQKEEELFPSVQRDWWESFWSVIHLSSD